MNDKTIINKRLGRLPAKVDPRTLRFANYAKALPPPPAQAGYISEVTSWPMFLNDQVGDCTIAAAAHMIQQWTTYASPTPAVPTDSEVLKAYEAVSGYVPGDESTDNGAVMLDVLKYWKKTGIAGHKVAAYVSVSVSNPSEIQQAVQLFGNCYIGVNLPIDAQNPIQGANGLQCWSMPSEGPVGDGAPSSWGGHCVPIVGYGSDWKGNRGVEVVTWGQLYDVTWGWLGLYLSEAWAVLSTDWVEKNGDSPSGFNLAQLQADLAQIK